MDYKFCRDKANECCREALAATDPDDKAAWLEMASSWRRLLSPNQPSRAAGRMQERPPDAGLSQQG